MAATQRTRTPVVLGVAAVVVVAVLAALVLRGGGGGGGTSPSTTTATPVSAGGTGLAGEGEALARRALASKGEGAPLVASANGTVGTLGAQKTQPAVAEVLGVEAGANDILLRWRLRSTGPVLDIDTLFFSPRYEPIFQMNGVALVDPSGKERGTPLTYRNARGGLRCACSITPFYVDQRGLELQGLYPLFTHAPAQVEVQIPGFPPITVPVTSR
ncbi:MAG TPA: hypothetical protein VFJ85_17005 [Acidimicrobiales bacterium]|nr:hypothetical protein [Acidimicrobiales bacterium]